MNNQTPLSLFSRACLIGGLFCLVLTFAGCGGSLSDDHDDPEAEKDQKTTQPVNCTNNPICH